MPDEAQETASQQSHSTPSANGTQANVFDVEDSPNNILVENGQIKLATIEKLVERVTSEKYFDPNFLQVFLLTYRQFITPKQLIELLMARYNIVDPVGVSPEELENYHKAVLLPVRLRIYNAVKHWISRHWVDFDDNPEMITLLRQLIKRMKETDQGNNANHLEKLLKKMTDDQKKEFVYMFDKQPPKPIPITKSRKTDHIPLLQIHPEEVARQLTLIEYDLFKAIKSWEFLNQGWTKKGKANKAPGILAMTKRFNDVSKWVATEIVSEKDKKGRVLVLNRLIEVAERCKNLNNLNAMTSIIAGLQSSSVYRLKALWPELPSKQLDIFEEMVELISSKHSYKNFREYLRRCEPPCIPYLGVYLTDLTFIEDGNPNLVNGMLNVGKCRSISKVILEILQHQQTPYCLEPVAAVQQYLNNLKFLEEEQCYKLSLQIEARSSTSAPSTPSSPQPASTPSNVSSSPASPSPLSASSTGKGLSSANANGMGMFAGTVGVSLDNMEVRIRLAGAKVPIRLPITAQTTAEDTIKSLTQQFYLQSSPSQEATEALLSNNFQLVVPPSQTMYGAIIEPDQTLKDFLAQNGDPVLEMWAHPIIYKVALSVQSNQPIFEDVLISHTMELMKTIPIFQKIFDLISSEEFCFLYVEPAKDGYA